MNQYHVIGLMSGTSLDGVDIAYCRFELFEDKWEYGIIDASTIPYEAEWKLRLQNLSQASAFDFVKTHFDYGRYLGKLVSEFVRKQNIKEVDFVASHGHTIFHQPLKNVTSQIGDGAALKAASGYTVVCDFRTSDVAYGGQGAPLVPIGDHYLFSDYTFCLNLGGIANISFELKEQRIAFDICFCNILLNHYASLAGYAYDEGGKLAASGKLHLPLLEKLNAWSFYFRPFPKSLGREDADQILQWIDSYKLPVKDVLHTLAQHIAVQIAQVVNSVNTKGKILCTGGGAFHSYLLDLLKEKCLAEVVIPNAKTINYKEALIFAFLGVLRMRGEPNCLQSVTGATKDVCGGAVYV
jgi:anhydro-N-acetylmuramic acid kinase